MRRSAGKLVAIVLVCLFAFVLLVAVLYARARPSCALVASDTVPAGLDGPAIERCIAEFNAELTPRHVVSDVTLGPFLVELEIMRRYHMPVQYAHLCFIHPSCLHVRHCLDEYYEQDLDRDMASVLSFTSPGIWSGDGILQRAAGPF